MFEDLEVDESTKMAGINSFFDIVALHHPDVSRVKAHKTYTINNSNTKAIQINGKGRHKVATDATVLVNALFNLCGVSPATEREAEELCLRMKAVTNIRDIADKAKTIRSLESQQMDLLLTVSDLRVHNTTPLEIRQKLAHIRKLVGEMETLVHCHM